MKKIKDFLKNIDSYGEPIEFTFRKKYKFSTVIGGFTSLLIMAFMTFYMYHLINELLVFKNPDSMLMYLHHSRPNELYFMSSENSSFETIEDPTTDLYLPLSIGIRNNSNNMFQDFDPRVFTIRFSLMTNNTTKILNFKKCSKPFNNVDPQNFNDLKLNGTYCLNDNVFISGRLVNTYQSLNLDVVGCGGNNDPYTGSCASSSEMDLYLQGVVIEMYFLNQRYNISNYDNPISTDIKELHFYLMSNFRLFVEYQVEIRQLSSYYSIFSDYLKGIIKQHYTAFFEDENIQIMNYSKLDPVLLNISFWTRKQNLLVFRKYLNIFEQLAFWGGFESVVNIIGYLACILFVKQRFDQALINSLYNMVDPQYDFIVNTEFEEYIKMRLIIIIKDHQNKACPRMYDDKPLKFINNNFDLFFDRNKIHKIFNINEQHEIYKFKFTNVLTEMEFEEKYVNLLSEKSVVEFYKYKIIFDIYKFEAFKNIRISYLQTLQGLCCRCFSTKNANKRFDLIDVGIRKLNIDVDFLFIVKGIKDFRQISKIYFNSYQNSMLKGTISHPIVIRNYKKFFKSWGANLLQICEEVNRKYDDPNYIPNFEEKNKINKTEGPDNGNPVHLETTHKPKHVTSHKDMDEMYKRRMNVSKSSYIDKFKKIQKIEQIKKRRNKLYSTGNKSLRTKLCCCCRNNQQISSIKNNVEDMIDFENIMEKMQKNGISNVDKKLLKDLGIDNESILLFSSEIPRNEKNYDINTANENLKKKEDDNIFQLINNKFSIHA